MLFWTPPFLAEYPNLKVGKDVILFYQNKCALELIYRFFQNLMKGVQLLQTTLLSPIVYSLKSIKIVSEVTRHHHSFVSRE
jgi:hypothetical protein